MRAKSIEVVVFDAIEAVIGCCLTVINYALFFTPLAPLVGIFLECSVQIGSFGVWAAKELFTKNDIFDPNCKTVIERMAA